MREEVENLKSAVDSEIEENLKTLTGRHVELLEKLDGKIEPVRMEFDEKFRELSESLEIFEARLESSGDVREKVKEFESFLPAAREEMENLRFIIESDIEEKLKTLTGQREEAPGKTRRKD